MMTRFYCFTLNLFIVFSCLFSSSSGYARIITVPGEWNTIQAGIDAAAESDTVLVAPGTYFENVDYKGKIITVASHIITTLDTSYISLTVIDGNKKGDGVIFNNCYGDSSAVLCGMTVQNGENGISANESNCKIINSYIENNGMGVYTVSSSVEFESCRININGGWSRITGGVYAAGSSLTINNTAITNNKGRNSGGIRCVRSVLTCTDTQINENQYFNTTEKGGITLLDSSEGYLKNVDIIGNFYGGVECSSAKKMVFENVRINDNASNYVYDYENNGIRCRGNAIFINCEISNNYYARFGGPKYYREGLICGNGSPVFINCLFANNYLAFYGSNCTPVLRNVTITGIVYAQKSAHPVFINSILTGRLRFMFAWDNYVDYSSLLTFINSDVYGLNDDSYYDISKMIEWLDGNIIEDPRFVDPDNGDFRLKDDSPCIGAGLIENAPEMDILGIIRGVPPDMGAYENALTKPLSNSIHDTEENTPEIIRLLNNTPNPFNTSTTIVYILNTPAHVSISIYTVYGAKVATLTDSSMPAGTHEKVWDASGYSSGVYFCCVKAGTSEKTIKMILLK